MKRDSGNFGGPPFKRQRDVEERGVTLRMLIPTKAAGSIIGKGGQNISKLRSENSATVMIPDCPGPERILTVGHDDKEMILKVMEQVLPALEEATQAVYGSRGGGDRGDRGGEDGGNTELRMLIKHAGCIIGKAGAKIKELRQQTGTVIRVFDECAPQSTERVVQIKGDAGKCIDALGLIIELQAEANVRDFYLYDPNNFDESVAELYGGWGGGRDSFRGGRAGGGPMSFPAPGRRGGMDDFGPPRGGSRGGRGGMRGGMDGGFGGGGGMGGGMRGGGGGAGGPVSSQQVSIPTNLAGAIIGKGGSRIKQVRMESGADITIDEPLPGSNDRIITISGTQAQIQNAQFLLQRSVREYGRP